MTCEEFDAAGAAGAVIEVGGAYASAVDIINPLTAARTTSVLLMSYLLGCKPPGGTTPVTGASSGLMRPRAQRERTAADRVPHPAQCLGHQTRFFTSKLSDHARHTQKWPRISPGAIHSGVSFAP
jgi:hypothetical protein